MNGNTNVGYAIPARSNMIPGIAPVTPLTTTAQKVLEPPVTEAPRWVLSGASLVNTTTSDRIVSFHYVPDGGSVATGNMFRRYEILANDTILLGEFPLLSGFSVWALVDSVDSSVNLFLPYEEVE